MIINWYPGHMKKSLEMLQDDLKKCDVIIYVLDARCPKSCLNPEFDKLANRKKVIYYHSKQDLAPASRCEKRNDEAIPKLPHELISRIKKLFPNKMGFIKAMVIGVPNCGKSTLINKLAKRKKTVTGDKPGVTKTKQWVPISDNIWCMDTPGVLWPKLDDEKVAKNLAYVGSIKDDILDIVELAKSLVADLKLNREITNEQSAKAVLVDFRAGKLGKFNLDKLL